MMPDKHRESIGVRVTRLRKAQRMKAERAAELADVSLNTYRKIECDSANPRLFTFIQLAKAFEVSLDYLVCRSDDATVRE